MKFCHNFDQDWGYFMKIWSKFYSKVVVPNKFYNFKIEFIEEKVLNLSPKLVDKVLILNQI